MTTRDTVWDEVLCTLVDQGIFVISDLDLDEGQRHTVRRVLKEMEQLGWLTREGKYSKKWVAGKRARLHLNLTEEAEAHAILGE